MALTARLVEDGDELEPHRAAWDRLAVDCGRPYCAPAWMLSWWRHSAPSGARLRVVLALEGERLVAVAPFYAQPRAGGARYRLLAAGTSSRLEPLAAAGSEDRAAGVIAAALAGSAPPAGELDLEGVVATSPWPELLRRAWPGRPPWLYREDAVAAPTVTVDGRGFEQWLGSKSRNFRQQARRDRRRLEEAGASFRLADADTLERDLDALERLHHARWEERGGSAVLNPAVRAMLADAGRELVAEGRFRLWSLDVGGETVSSHLFLAAGGETAYWLGGFDDSWAEARPAIQTLLAAIEDSTRRGERRVDLGAGGQHYKYRLADGEDTLEWLRLLPRGRRYPVARARLAPRQARRALARLVPKETRKRIKLALRRRVGR